MPIFVRGLTLGLDEPEERLVERAAARLRVPVGDIRCWAVVRRSIDARRKDRLQYTYNVELALAGSPKREAALVRRLRRQDVSMLVPQDPPDPVPGREPLPGRPVVVGFGPAGMFAGYLLASFGYQPLIIDRGFDVSTRHRDIMVDFYRHRRFHPESNLLFGEGGAGTYSDGKLYTRVHDPRTRLILEIFYQHGANPAILIDGKPHIGSDKLPGICRRIRMHIEKMGGEVRFGSRLDDVVIEDGTIKAVVVNGERIDCGPVLLGVGHSARDTLRMLGRRGVQFVPKPFQLGVRIEHPQAMIDRWQYGDHCGNLRLPPASYELIAKGAAGAGDVFSFCMCPGGTILPTNESPGEIATNGASRSKRGGAYGNAGLVVTLQPAEVCPEAATDALKAFDYLEQIERTAFMLTGESYRVPCQRAGDFVAGRSSDGTLETSYPLGGQWLDLRRVIPPFVADAIRRGLEILDRRLPGFAGADGLITAPETRASGPVRLLRHPDTRESVSTALLYPIGEGAGYAGGIVSAAIDGLKSAEAVISRYAVPKA
ncbi:MAG TPA: FAD-dependent oxidoreductase [Phycisphaerae bacterium]|nr:FAD-dependent oxidoreductase [Phycisphaerae bacterium]HOJ75151.1 FAD-dependent oxidoreductase [Phycisphaerae bacterium]HON66249.1 FAD-dependent oxidoreductase [Phycisphaerae bacterium]HPP27446.1 FAD-dependent oxidoreductase [Phycisphaerae bacterium]HPU26029.1 FAD-dependent oxidoreductase [Phycisphaerae bacterium]